MLLVLGAIFVLSLLETLELLVDPLVTLLGVTVSSLEVLVVI